jgi:hypothetical protein
VDDITQTRVGASEPPTGIGTFAEIYRTLYENSRYASKLTNSSYEFGQLSSDVLGGTPRHGIRCLLSIDRSGWNQHETYYMAVFTDLIILRVGHDRFRIFVNSRDVQLPT